MLTPGQALPGGWTVAASDAAHLRVERAAGLERQDALRRLGFLLVPLVLATAALAGTWDAEPALQALAWPVAALLGLVVLLGVLSAARAVGRARAGVRLEVDGEARTVTGFPQASGSLSDYRAGPLTCPFEGVARARVTVFRGASPSAPALVRVSVELAAGPQLQGPELAAPDAEWELARDRLAPLAAELARLLGCPHDVSVVPAR